MAGEASSRLIPQDTVIWKKKQSIPIVLEYFKQNYLLDIFEYFTVLEWEAVKGNEKESDTINHFATLSIFCMCWAISIIQHFEEAQNVYYTLLHIV